MEHKEKYLIFGNGDSVHIVKWTKELIKYFDVYIISSCNFHPEIKEMIPAGKLFPLDLKISPEGGNIKILSRIHKVIRIIRKIRPVYLNAHYITSHGFLIALIRKFTRIRFILIHSAWGTDILVSPFINKSYYAITKFTLRQSDIVSSDSDHMTDVIRKFCNNMVLTFPFGLNSLPEISIEEKKEGIYFSNRALTPNYNIDKVLNFFRKILVSDSKARLVIANDGDLKESLVKIAEELGIEDKVCFTGFITHAEQEKYYRESVFYISVPESDSTSVSLLEAMSYGCIPVVSDIPANKQWVEHNQNGVFLTSETDRQNLTVLLNRHEEIFRRNREIIKEKAIFPDSIQHYAEQIKTIKTVK